ncbi:nitroreductase/quinone reductase family protein [Sinosporangium siamense]|uniref:Cation-binding protein n=1 Tax=Sinosporangium siamense TaxID=1367973 RepID=A0A919RFA4_9ACTN|nr:nitroreductase/quinone reductase family protein [Sinosporangium siamense]GII90821.1 cation-binding protein [Sinosporangium siamense]
MSTSFNQAIIEEFRANGGKVGGPFEGGDLLLLTTTGAKSGREHTAPLGYVRDGDLLLIVGSAGGADRHPAWYHNLLAHPLVQVEIGTDAFEAIAVPAVGARRDELFERVVRVVPGYADYQTQTDRVIPVVMLERSDEGEPPAITNLADKLLQVHTWLRGQLDHVHEEAAAYVAARAAHQGGAAPPRPGLGLRLRQHCLAFCQFLEVHHTGEDSHMFPWLEGRHPHLADTFRRLGEEHRTVSRLQKEIVALLADIDAVAPERFMAELRSLTAELHAHLDFEEKNLIPVLAEIRLPFG